MAKKKTKTKKGGFNLNLRALVLIVVGLAIFGLAFVPATKMVFETLLKGQQVVSTNFYSLIGEAFKEGASAEYLIMGISSLLTLICAGLCVVLGVLWMFNILNNQASLIALILYSVMFVSLITYLICFFVWKGNMNTLEIGGFTITKDTPISTFVYFLLGVNVAGAVGHLLLRNK